MVLFGLQLNPGVSSHYFRCVLAPYQQMKDYTQKRIW